MGLLDSFNDPQSMGLLNAAAQILQGSGNVRQPFGLGQALGTGISGYMQGNAAGQAQQQQRAEEEQQRQMRAMQMQQMQAQQEQQQAGMRKQGQIDDAFRQSMPGGQIDSQALISRVMQIDPQKGMELQAKFAKQTPEFYGDVKTGQDAQGRPFQYILDKQGNQKRLDGTLPREEMKLANLNNRMEAYNPFSMAPGQTLQMGQSPDNIATTATAMRGQNMTDSRAREMNEINRQGQRTQIINDPNQGPLLIDKGTGVARQAVGQDGSPIRGEAVIKKETQAKGLVNVIDSAEKLLDGSTGSYAGAGVDKAAQFFGKSTDGAQKIAQLRVLEGSIMMNQPRMEGPQSDKDVALYRQMAGQIGDPTVPAALKKVALQQIKEINQRYAGGAQQPAQQTSQPTRKSVMKGQIIDGYRFKGGDPSDQNNWEVK